MIYIEKLIWDEHNIAHIARHNIMPIEVEQACNAEPITDEGKKYRLLVIGFTKANRLLTAVLQPTGIEGVYRPITAFDASPRQRRYYNEQLVKRGGDNNDEAA
jgi:uncharacterized DUF497 family protein